MGKSELLSEDYEKTGRPAVGAGHGIFLVRGVSAPVGSASGVETLWRSVADHDAKTYYFDSAVSPSVFWVDLNKVDLQPGAKTMTLQVSKDNPLAGEVSSQFEEAEPFEFL